MDDTRPDLRCGVCSRVFSRKEHLIRHSRRHTNDKPHTCEHCAKQFARSDTYKRHLEASHPTLAANGGHGRGGGKRQRTVVACDACHYSKVRCTMDQPPCPRCVARGIPCKYVRPSHAVLDRRLDMGQKSVHADHTPPSSVLPDSERVAGPSPNQQHFPAQLLPDHNQGQLPLDPAAPYNAQQDDGSQCLLFPDYGFLRQPTVPMAPISSLTEGYIHGDDSALSAVLSNSDTTRSTHGFDFVPQELSCWLDAPFSVSEQRHIDLLGASSWPSVFCPHDATDHEDVGVTDNDPTQPFAQARRIAAAYENLQNLSNAHLLSRPASPRARHANQQWLDNLSTSEWAEPDRVVLDTFLDLFEQHVADTFECFRAFTIERFTPPELYLAMAAVGGLYCSTAGAVKIATWLCEMARRKLLTKVHATRPIEKTARVPLIKTFIALQLFGYLSGNKRHYELIEVFHFEMLRIVQDSGLWYRNPDVPEEERMRLVHSLYMLECYRVVIIHRPPVFLPVSSSAALSKMPSVMASQASPQDEVLSRHLQSILSASSPGLRIYSVSLSKLTLCALVLATSQAAYHDLPSFAQGENGTMPRSSDTLWQQAFFEHSLHNWRCAHDVVPSANTMILFHAVHLNMHASLLSIQDFAKSRLFQQSQGKGDKPPRRLFRSDDDKRKALWHARQILHLALRMRTEGESHTQTDEDASLSENNSRDACEVQAPHYTHALFFASLCFWCLGASREFQLGQARMARAGSEMAKVFLQLLSLLASV
ncbi:hypothetical protein Sste5346_008719 [Sporothrix stenoceras]|uniref:Uncharacterized protein n=1 Tax=Sporothrix stenoceras TaxID=5173 RepID=A0ABR3YN23_9PEZI